MLSFYLILSLVSVCKGWFVANQVDAPLNYTIGDPFGISWNSSALNTSTINIYLYCKNIYNNSWQNWLLKSNVNNSGYDNVEINITYDLIHLSIGSESQGYFFVAGNPTNLTSKYMQLTTSQASNLYQPMYMNNISSALYSIGDEVKNDVIIYVKNSIIEKIANESNMISFNASYVMINKLNNTWNINQYININNNWTILNTSELYTTFHLNVYMISKNTYNIGGPFMLNIGINGYSYYYYTINGNYLVNSSQFVIYDPNDIHLTLDSLTYNEIDVDTIDYWENIQYNFTISKELYNVPLYIVLKQYPLIGPTSYYSTSCYSLLASQWINNRKLGWKFIDEYGGDIIHRIPQGIYDFEIYWAIDDEFYSRNYQSYLFEINSSNIAHDIKLYYNHDHSYNFNISIFNDSIIDNNNNSNVPAVFIRNTNTKNAYKYENGLVFNGNNDIDYGYNEWIFITSYNYGEIIYYSFEQYYIDDDDNHTVHYNQNLTWYYDSFRYNEYEQEVDIWGIEFPLIIGQDYKWNTFIHVYTFTCDHSSGDVVSKLSTRIRVNTTKTNDDDWWDIHFTLLEWVILGIVIFVVIIIYSIRIYYYKKNNQCCWAVAPGQYNTLK